MVLQKENCKVGDKLLEPRLAKLQGTRSTGHILGTVIMDIYSLRPRSRPLHDRRAISFPFSSGWGKLKVVGSPAPSQRLSQISIYGGKIGAIWFLVW